MMSEQMNTYIEKKIQLLYITPSTKLDSNRIRDLNAKSKSIKLLEEKIRRKINVTLGYTRIS